MYDPFDELPVIFTVTARNQHADTDGKTDEEVDQKVRQSVGRADRADGVARFGKLSDDDKVCRIIQKLQHIGQHQGNRKANDLTKQRTTRHVDFITCSSFAP